jgi:hypothetical protein
MFDDILSKSQDVNPVVSDGERATAAVQSRSPIRSDGSATWTIPLTVTVNVGGQSQPTAPVSDASQKSRQVGPTIDPRPAPTEAPNSQQQALKLARVELKKKFPNIMNVRLGYVFDDNGKITKDRALVVTVRRKLKASELSSAVMEPLPITFAGLKVQISDPTIPELLQEATGTSVTEATAAGLPISAEEITYVPPKKPGLNRTKAKMRVTAHLSPDAGWAELSEFLKPTSKSLIVGMYDFGAKHIVDAIKALAKKKGL